MIFWNFIRYLYFWLFFISKISLHCWSKTSIIWNHESCILTILLDMSLVASNIWLTISDMIYILYLLGLTLLINRCGLVISCKCDPIITWNIWGDVSFPKKSCSHVKVRVAFFKCGLEPHINFDGNLNPQVEKI